MSPILVPLLLLAAPCAGIGASDAFQPSVWGLELAVSDVPAAERAYCAAFGFRSVFSGGEVARLEKDGLALVFVSSSLPRAAEDAASVHLNLEVRALELALARALAAGFLAPEPAARTIPIGRAWTVVDADGYAVNLIELDAAGGSGDRGPGEDGPGADSSRVFNVGLDLEQGADWEFVEALGFRVLTRAYVPDALPTAKAGAAELVLHRAAQRPRALGTKAAVLLLDVENLEPALQALAPRGFADLQALPRATSFGRRAALTVPSGLRLELLERSPAQFAFERLCALAGSWEGQSSAGWNARCEIEVIARGSVVLERTNFEAHPEETMLTLFHRDGSELVLTHYCVAGNQPRLVASAIGPDERPFELHFTFRAATNLASRDQGHMDEAVLQLEGPDAFSSKWSFFQAGKASWMEEIRYRRLAPVQPRAAPLPSAASSVHEH